VGILQTNAKLLLLYIPPFESILFFIQILDSGIRHIRGTGTRGYFMRPKPAIVLKMYTSHVATFYHVVLKTVNKKFFTAPQSKIKH
jgi:hypothetical protein